MKLSQDQIDMLDYLIGKQFGWVNPGEQISHLSKGKRRQAKKALEKKKLYVDGKVTLEGLHIRGVGPEGELNLLA